MHATNKTPHEARTPTPAPATRWSNRRGVAARLRDAVLKLPVTINSIATTQQELGGAMKFTRVTTTVALTGASGAGRVGAGGEIHTGRGEDIAYSPDVQRAAPDMFAALDIAGEWTVGSLSAHLDGQTLDAPGVTGDDKANYHRWAVESAALDLALRQAGTTLGELVGETPAPVRVSLSMGLGTPPSTDTPRAWLKRDSRVNFKIDVSSEWTPALIAQLASLSGAVATVDFKGFYTGEWIDNDYPPELYRAITDGLPHALIEDAKLSDAVLAALDDSARARLSWDFPICAPQDVPGLPSSTATWSTMRPGAINIKPSRFGTIDRLLATIALCDTNAIACYSGGQYELGIGRTQVQEIASLCYPDAPNDCAPVLFHGAAPDTVAELPLTVSIPSNAGRVGFGWDVPTHAQGH